MAEIRTVTTLRRKRDEIRRAISNYERKLDQAKADLAHIAAAIHIFEAKGGEPPCRSGDEAEAVSGFQRVLAAARNERGRQLRRLSFRVAQAAELLCSRSLNTLGSHDSQQKRI
jgi:hypothetical protein